MKSEHPKADNHQSPRHHPKRIMYSLSAGKFRFAHSQRKQIKQTMQDHVFDLVIIGGGITGAGAARDAVSRGMSVALIEAQDFAQGTSSRSSKLIHGGIRYLENYEFGLVFEALSERSMLFEMAPHLVHPLRFVLPLYEGGRVGMFKMGLGMWAYDALSMFEAPELHERLSPEETIDRLPSLKPEGLLGSYCYSDAYMDDDRLVIETLRSATQQGALALNFMKASGAQFATQKSGETKMTSLEVEDQLTHEKFTLRGRHFISTVGPWTDTLGQSFFNDWHKLLRPSKGVHLVFDRNRIPLKQAVVMAADKDKRIVFGIPRHEMIIVGTTDTDFPGDPSTVSATPEDIRYLLKIASEYFPGANLTEKDILSSYAGVRPLVHDGSETESKTSREHVILDDPRNITFVAGGKYTTYRLMAEQTVEASLKSFPIEDQIRFQKNSTEEALNPHATVELLERARRLVSEWSQEFAVDQDTVAFLVERHAFEVPNMIESYLKNKALSPSTAKATNAAISSDAGLRWQIEAHHAIRETMCVNLVDFYTRRAPLFLSQADHGMQFLPAIAQIFANDLNWTSEQKNDQIRILEKYIESELKWRGHV